MFDGFGEKEVGAIYEIAVDHALPLRRQPHLRVMEEGFLRLWGEVGNVSERGASGGGGEGDGGKEEKWGG